MFNHTMGIQESVKHVIYLQKKEERLPYRTYIPNLRVCLERRNCRKCMNRKGMRVQNRGMEKDWKVSRSRLERRNQNTRSGVLLTYCL